MIEVKYIDNPFIKSYRYTAELSKLGSEAWDGPLLIFPKLITLNLGKIKMFMLYNNIISFLFYCHVAKYKKLTGNAIIKNAFYYVRYERLKLPLMG